MKIDCICKTRSANGPGAGIVWQMKPCQALVRENSPPEHFYEKDVARRWYALSPGVRLPLSNGDIYQLVFAGRPGSALGPDVRDAVFHPCSVGDVEFHIRASDWFAHLHHIDARYNNVILHVVLILDDLTPTLRQDGAIIPTCSFQDVPSPPRLVHTSNLTTTWPCHSTMQEMSTAERANLLRHAGLLRFVQKTYTFVELLHDSPAYDTCLILALAEGLGYGRDRAFFRAAGRYLLGLADDSPEPLGRTPDPPPLDAQRLRVLHNLVAQWRTSGAWQTLKAGIQGAQPLAEGTLSGGQVMGVSPKLLSPSPPQTANQKKLPSQRYVPTSPISSLSTEKHRVIQTLRAVFTGLSTARSDILICNVVLPFAAAVALLEHDNNLFAQAQTLYIQYPGLSSNQVTRAMCKQLLLFEEPSGACQQQGLHYIYQQTCREKHCDLCIMGRRTL